ncbi:MAG: hypothetical protein H0W82_02985 [Actinobacteria bacterium]|nr:hypothetical protein [Actinomycetota bacterium]
MALTKKLVIAPNEIAVAWQGASWGEYSIQAGTRLRGSHPMVRALGAAVFVPDGTPVSEMPHPLDAVIAEADAVVAPPPPPPRISPDTALGDLAICTTEVFSSAEGPCRAGRIVHKGDPLVAAAPTAFAPLLTRLGS